MLSLMAHMTKEQSDAIGMLVLTVAVAAAVVVVLVLWGVVVAIRAMSGRRDENDDPDN